MDFCDGSLGIWSQSMTICVLLPDLSLDSGITRSAIGVITRLNRRASSNRRSSITRSHQSPDRTNHPIAPITRSHQSPPIDHSTALWLILRRALIATSARVPPCILCTLFHGSCLTKRLSAIILGEYLGQELYRQWSSVVDLADICHIAATHVAVTHHDTTL